MHNSDHVILLEYFLIKYYFIAEITQINLHCLHSSLKYLMTRFKSSTPEHLPPFLPMAWCHMRPSASKSGDVRSPISWLDSFRGEIPSSEVLGRLFRLRVFALGNNSFTGSLPYDLGNLSSLQFIGLGRNFLEGGIPDSIGQLKSLYFLSLDENMLSSKLPPSIYNLSSLWSLRNHFFGPLPSSLFNISTLEMLELSGNGFTGKVHDNMGNMQKLQFLGNIPQDIGKLNNLGVLTLGNNNLSGRIPSSINNLARLLYLELDHNNFEGVVPNTRNLQSLLELDISGNKLNATLEQVFGQTSHGLLYAYLADNSFTGSLPVEVGNFEYVVDMDVSNNYLEGEIPNTLGKCLSLQQLSLMGNSFRGSIPPSFSSLQGLKFLDLSQNNFSGEIPMFLQNLSSSLEYLNLSFNNFEGAMPTQGIFQNASAFSILGNNKLCGGISELQLPACPIIKQKRFGKHQISLGLKVAIGAIVSTTVLAALLSVLCWVMRRTKSGTDETQKTSLYDHYERVSFLELHRATEGFSPANSIGTGTLWASKFDEDLNRLLNVDFQGNDFKAIIFKFMPNGSLENWLHSIRSDGSYLAKNLNLSRRLNIAIDVASALDYLHNQCETPIIHCDLKPSNILLDEDMVAHVGDFGLAKFLQRKNSNSGTTDTTSSFSPRGTIGYIPPGRRPTDEEFEDGLDLHQFCKIALRKEVMKIIDPHVLEHEEEANDDHRDIHVNNSEIQRSTHHESGKTEECITSIIKVGVECSMPSASERMGIKDALKELVAAKKLYQSAR
ncbi:hypothetical protein Syun_031447 [Stephania yunnanensis]|uniref:non-specific serine/threonine protein kinase n=1 Tax=Stephania yunnanensis TaxID=152371 RepID=A0AAP0HBD9_9MAGN